MATPSEEDTGQAEIVYQNPKVHMKKSNKKIK
jgi:hypothetical protein